MQAAGIVLIFAALPVFVIPLIEQAVSSTPPRAVDGIEGHVLVRVYTPRAAALVAELDDRGVSAVIVDPDRETATELQEAGRRVAHGDPESAAVLRAAGIGRTRAAVADGPDETAASIVLAAKEAAEDVFAVSVADEPDLADYHRYAGADRVLSPRALLGESLANRVTTAIATDLDEVLDMDESFSIREVPVEAGSEASGREFADSGLEALGASVLGVWVDGGFSSPPSPGVILDERTCLLALGREAQLHRLEAQTRSQAGGCSGGDGDGRNDEGDSESEDEREYEGIGEDEAGCGRRQGKRTRARPSVDRGFRGGRPGDRRSPVGGGGPLDGPRHRRKRARRRTATGGRRASRNGERRRETGLRRETGRRR
jgi:Trk K+ transport system NAD-binding subunit